MTILALRDDISALEDEVSALEAENSTLAADLDGAKNQVVALGRTIEVQRELIEEIEDARDVALVELGLTLEEVALAGEAETPEPVTSKPAVPVSTPTTTVPDNTQWCLKYKLDLEVAGQARAVDTLRDPISGSSYNQMTRGMYKDWVVKPLADAGCPVPAGYPAP